MRLVSYHHGTGDRLGIEAAAGHIWSSRALGPGLPASMAELLEGGETALAALRSAAGSATDADRPGDVDPATRIAPVPRPSKIMAVGLNYRDHVEEQGGKVKVPASPVLFAKFPSAVIGHGATVEWDPQLTGAVDLEAELAIVIGRLARRVSRDDAFDHVLGYTCVNDVTARDLQYGDRQFVRGKSLDTFCPMGPAVVTRDELPDPGSLAVRSWRNDELMQESNTSHLIFDLPYLVSFCSQAFTLLPGDVICTGTPSGVGYFREPKVLMGDGDVMSVEVEGVGRLTNPCRELGRG